jgi:hypothetical protein
MMMNKLRTFLNPDYVFAVPQDSTYEVYFLYISILVILVVLFLKIFFRFKKRSSVYSGFDRLWFWGYFILGLTGVFLWFSRNQQLPTFGTRFATYLWLNSLWIYALFIFYYYKKYVTKAVISHHEKKRKEKYLKR